jgi:hypothetical protein
MTRRLLGAAALCLLVAAPARAQSNRQHGMPGMVGVQNTVSVPDTLPLPPAIGQGTPAYPVRALQFSLAYARDLRLFPFDDVFAAAERYHFTTVILQVDNAVRYASLPETAPPLVADWSVVQDIARRARAHKLEVVAGVNMLGHQDLLTATAHPEWLVGTNTLDPRIPAVRQAQTAVLDELVDSLQVKTVLIGHDEADLSALTPAEARRVFAGNVTRLAAHLTRRGVRTAIYGDLLLASTEFPGLSSCHGKRLGAAALRAALPRTLIVLDRHSARTDSAFASVDSLRAHGFTVWGTTSLDRTARAAFARDAAPRGAGGMVLATYEWAFLKGGPVGLYREMRHAATLFWNPAATPLDDPLPRGRVAARP